jgi:predicted Zn finger-like uncharacterized protein
MHITCPHCAIKFIIPLGQISHSGRYVRCSKCGYLWHTKEPQTFNQQDEIKPINDYIKNEGVNLPAIVAKNNKKHTRFFTIIVTILIVLSAGYYIKNFLHEMIFAHDTLKVEEISVINYANNDLTLQYQIKCNNCSFFNLPLIRFRLYDKDFRLVNSYLSEDLFKQLIANDNIVIKTDLINIPTTSKYIDITLGSYFTLFFK